MNTKRKPLALLVLIAVWPIIFISGRANAQCDLGTQIQGGTGDINVASGVFVFTDQGDPGDGYGYAGLPVAGDCGALISTRSDWTASLHVSLAAETLVATAEDEPYVDLGLIVLINGDINNRVYAELEQLNYSGHTDDSDVYGAVALFEAVKNNRNIPTTALGGGGAAAQGTSYVAVSKGASSQPITQSIGPVSGLLTLTYNATGQVLTGYFNGKPFGRISLNAFGANPSITLCVAGASGGSAVVDSGAAQADSLSVTVPPPVFAVVAPVNNAVIATSPPVVTLHGSVKGSTGIAAVWCALNGDTNSPILVESWESSPFSYLNPKNGLWSGSIDLSKAPGAEPGKNVLSFWAVDNAGLASTVVTRTVNWTLTTKLALSIAPSPDAGRTHGLANNQTLVVGRTYAVTAAPANPGWAFWKWTDATGDVLATNAACNFVPDVSPADVAQGVALIANFVPNPFPLVAGSYVGLFSVSTNLTPTNAGYISLTVSKSGAFSGSILFQSRVAHPLSGRFDLASQFQSGDPTALASAVVPLSKTTALGLSLRLLGLTNGMAPALDGLVNFYNVTEKRFIWPQSADLSVKLVSDNSNAAEGRYNFVLPPISPGNPGDGPDGYSFGSATLGRSGGVTVALTLADGVTPLTSLSTSVAADGAFPVYLPLYGGQGLLFGWMQFTNDASQTQFNGATLDLESANLSWLANSARYYPAGFASDAASFFVFGSRYVAPETGADILGYPQLTFQMDAGLGDVLAAALAFNPKTGALSAIDANPDKLSLHLNQSSGALSGTEVIAGKTISIKGVLLPPLATAYGFYIGTGKTDVPAGQSGPFTIFGSNTAPDDR